MPNLLYKTETITAVTITVTSAQLTTWSDNEPQQTTNRDLQKL